MNNAEKRILRLGLLFISPWIIGFLAFAVYPLLSTIYFSLCDYPVLSPAVFVGATNYKDPFTDAISWKAVYNTSSSPFSQSHSGWPYHLFLQFS